MAANSLAVLKLGSNQHAQICAPSQEDAAKLFNVSRRNVQHAREVRKADSSVAEMVCAGTINLHEGKKLIALPAEARRSAVQAVASGADVRTAIRAAKKIGCNARIDATKPKSLEGTYRIIYIDPPWKYHGLNQADEYGHAERHYDCLDDNQLCEFRPDGKRLVKELADDNSVLFMWVTAPMLERSFPIIKAWGFDTRRFFVWDKVKHNVGYYNSVRAELLLVCTRGSWTPDTGKLIDSVQSIERSNKHSQKPVEFYDIIEAMYDHGRKLKIFARSGRKGWDSVGNEMSGMTAIGRGPCTGAYMPFGKAKKKKSRPALAA